MMKATNLAHPFRRLAGDAPKDQTPTIPRHRPGYAMAEAVLAFAILGIALAGLAPFVVTQLRLIHKLETRFQGNPVYRNGQPYFLNQPTHTYSIIAWKNPRMRGLFGRAAITVDSPVITSAQGSPVDDYTPNYQGQPAKANTLTIYGFTPSFTDLTSDPSSVVVNVDVEPSS